MFGEWLYHSRNRKRIIILNYDALQAFIDYGYAACINTDRAMIGFDQSTEIKNHSAQRTKAAIKLAREYRYKRILAGKLTSNGNHELWAQLKVIDAVHMSFWAFRNVYSVLGGYMGKQVVGNQNTEHLRQAIEPYVYVAGDEFLAEFEPKIYGPIRQIAMTGEQAKAYKQMEKDFFIELEGGGISAQIALTKYLRLAQIASGFATDDNGNVVELVKPNSNPRLQEAYRIVRDEVDNKVIIFYRFKQSFARLLGVMAEFNPAYIVGGMDGAELEEHKARFDNDPECKVLLAQIEVAKMGHTLPGLDTMPCDTIIFYENSYSLITRSECEARPEKMGRKVPIEVIDFAASGEDRKIIKALQQKEDVANALMGYNREFGVLYRGEGAVHDEL